MPEEFNPYEAPTYQIAPDPEPEPLPTPNAPANPQGIWQDGELLVMHRDARLPKRCVKSNQPASGWLDRKLRWHSPWLIVVFFVFGPLIYIIVSLIVTKKADIQIGLTNEWLERRRRTIRNTTVLAVLGLVLCAVSFLIAATVQIAMLILLSGVVLFFVSAIYGSIGSRMISVKRMDDRLIWIKGVHHAYLATLPDVMDR